MPPRNTSLPPAGHSSSSAETAIPKGSSRRAIAIYLVLLAAAIAGGTAIWKIASPGDPQLELRAARESLDRGDFPAAIHHARRVPRSDARRPRAALIEGEASFRLGHISQADSAFQEAASAGGPDVVIARIALGELWRSQGHLARSEEFFLEALRDDPQNKVVLDRLILLLVLSGRRWEALSYARERIDLRGADSDTYLLAADPERGIENPDYLVEARRSCPDDPIIAAGLGLQAFAEGRFTEARSLLERDDLRKPGWASVQAVVGEIRLSSGLESFADWYRKAAPLSADSPEFHLVCGLFAQRRGEYRVAARCFQETIRLAPNHHRGNYQLAQALVHLADEQSPDPDSQQLPSQQTTDLLERLRRRTDDLRELGLMLEKLHRSDGRSEPAFRKVVELLERTGQVRLASEFSVHATQVFPQSPWARQAERRLLSNPLRGSWAIDPNEDLSRFVDVDSFPEFGPWLDGLGAGRSSTPGTMIAARIKFRQEPRERLSFEYRNAHDPAIRGVRMQEQAGGGVAVLDYDRDGWPDLAFPQGGAWPEGSDVPRIDADSQDRLFRNRGGESYQDVSVRAGIAVGGFGQGAASGDVNCDGFPDLYIANIGVNDLWINHGDGTFSRAPVQSDPPARWTTSCAIVDLNRDGDPDLYDVNYLTGSDIYRMRCNGRACSPRGFSGSPDDVWISNGRDGFDRQPGATDESEGKGLGIVAFLAAGAESASQSPRLDLLIANDQVPNFLLRNAPGSDLRTINLVDEAFLSGLALNQNGLAMASMGIACDDADQDGLLDFFITNFKDEYDGLYLQRPGGLFQEASATAGLHGENFRYVGWGTQFLDADLDGAPDIVAVNGHVDDYRDEGGDFAMPPQFYRNRGNGQFEELSSDALGEYFQSLWHGRGLARVDWNRDGLPDFVVSNNNQPASLVTNGTGGSGRFLKVRLVGTVSDRDGIGTRVRVKVGAQAWEKQLVAGDGYMASNERVLHFGLGEVTRIDSVEAHWMSGRTTRITGVPVDHELMIIEDDAAMAWDMKHPVSRDQEPNPVAPAPAPGHRP